ncbi:hypothetical protein [uncultured Bacteroides sp.]|uniref:hypothetical protein n=1 Tax=uncultured Bacteroides sp. TaxID=162156 RepID=UPI0026037418|nr:hypothetical protein [uncultured Bacteroides sp.]
MKTKFQNYLINLPIEDVVRVIYNINKEFGLNIKSVNEAASFFAKDIEDLDCEYTVEGIVGFYF